jgi:hypothetical protein
MNALGYFHYRNDAHNVSIILYGARNLVESSFGFRIGLKWCEQLYIGEMLGRIVMLAENESKGSATDAENDVDLTNAVC